MTAEPRADGVGVAGVRDVLAEHFVMWHDLEGPIGGEWRCACGLKFGFSDSAIDHQAEQVAALLAAPEMREAVSRSLGCMCRTPKEAEGCDAALDADAALAAVAERLGVAT